MISNKNIDSLLMRTFLTGGALHIEESMALAAFVQYVRDLELLSAGVPYAQLNMSARREATKPLLLDASSAVLSDPYDYRRSNNTPENSIALISLKGVMLLEGGECAYGIEDTIRFLEMAVNNKNIDGILFEVNTGGGEARAGEALKYAVQEAVSKKPVLDFITGTKASAGVMAMLPCTESIAKTDRCKIGSIGTYMSIDKEFLAWYKANIIDIYADKSTNKNIEFKQMLEGDFSGIQKMVNRTNENFLADVQAFRPLAGDIEHTLSGAMFDTNEAKKRGLVDGQGNLAYAIKRIQYHQKNSY